MFADGHPASNGTRLDEEVKQGIRERISAITESLVRDERTKTRRGDRDVSVSVPDVDRWKDHTPVLVDDIISTPRMMIETVGHLRRAGFAAPVCVGVHPVFAAGAHDALPAAGPERVVTCNTIDHPSNGIDLSGELAATARTLPGQRV